VNGPVPSIPPAFRAIGVVFFVAVSVLGICSQRAPVSPHQTLSADARELREAFNAEVGKPRVVMLVAPT
jgi:hypothetical protein